MSNVSTVTEKKTQCTLSVAQKKSFGSSEMYQTIPAYINTSVLDSILDYSLGAVP